MRLFCSASSIVKFVRLFIRFVHVPTVIVIINVKSGENVPKKSGKAEKINPFSEFLIKRTKKAGPKAAGIHSTLQTKKNDNPSILKYPKDIFLLPRLFSSEAASESSTEAFYSNPVHSDEVT